MTFNRALARINKFVQEHPVNYCSLSSGTSLRSCTLARFEINFYYTAEKVTQRYMVYYRGNDIVAYYCELTGTGYIADPLPHNPNTYYICHVSTIQKSPLSRYYPVKKNMHGMYTLNYNRSYTLIVNITEEDRLLLTLTDPDFHSIDVMWFSKTLIQRLSQDSHQRSA